MLRSFTLQNLMKLREEFHDIGCCAHTHDNIYKKIYGKEIDSDDTLLVCKD